jgi:uncharacterized protein YeaO (DUF488 family)
MIRVKRVYDAPSRSDGCRILVDRLWPRGQSKEKAHIDLWLKEIGPSTELRHWFGHDESRWRSFKERYFRELKEKEDLVCEIHSREKRGTVTLLYSARDEKDNNAVALKEYIERGAVTV